MSGLEDRVREGDLLAWAHALKMISYAAVSTDTEPSRGPRYSRHEVFAWALTGALLIAGSSYWAGRVSMTQSMTDQITARAFPTATIHVRQPRSAEIAIPEIVATTPGSSSKPAFDAGALGSAPLQEKKAPVRNDQAKPRESVSGKEASPVPAADQPNKNTADLNGIWSAQVVEGAGGRLVRIGHFSTVSEAQKRWEAVLRQYPGMQRLRSLPVAIKSLRDGHTYYRLQVGTSSPAHSEVLCQRARDMDQSCTVIGLDQGSREISL